MGIFACCDVKYTSKYENVRSIFTMEEPNGTINHLFPLTDNRFAVIISEKIVKVYRITPEETTCEVSFNFEKKYLPSSATKVNSLCQTSNGNLIIIQAKYYQIVNIDPKNLKVLACQTPPFEISKVTALPNNRIACTLVKNENIIIFNLQTETEILQAAVLKGTKNIYRMLIAGEFLFVYREGETIEKWNLNTYQCDNTIQLQNYNLINFFAYNDKLLYTSQKSTIVSIDTETSKISDEKEYDKGEIKEMALLDEQTIVFLTDKSSIMFYNKENDYFFEIDANKENKTKGKLIAVSNKFFVVCDSSNTYKIWKNQ